MTLNLYSNFNEMLNYTSCQLVFGVQSSGISITIYVHKITLFPYMGCGNLQNQNALNEYLCSAFITIILAATKTLFFFSLSCSHPK